MYFLLPIFILVTLLTSVLVAQRPALAATSSTLNFQGRLLDIDGGLVADGSYNIEFKLYTVDTGGTEIWTENRTGGSTVTVRNGYFSVYLGEVTPFGASIPWDQELWLTMNVEGDGEMSPRFKLTAVPYAFRAGAVTDSAGNAYTGDDLAQLAPTSIQEINAAVGALRLNQTGSGSLLQLQGDGSDVFTVDKTGAATLGSGITVGNSTSTTAGTVRWTGADLEVYDGSGWVSLTSGSGGGGGTLTFESFYGYDATGDINISGGWTDITLDTEVKEDSPYTHATDAAAVTINDDGWYEISYNVSAYTSSGGNSDASIAAKLQENTGGGFTDIPGSFGYSAVTTGPSDGNVAVTITRQFSAGDIVKIQAQRTGDAITVLTRANSAGLSIRKFVEPTGGGGGTSFEQGGNDFGATAILGTTSGSGDGLTFITDGSAALSFTSGGVATFSQDVSFNGDITSSSGLMISSGGGGDLTLDSASDVLAINDATIRRSASGTTTIDLFDSGGGTTLSIENSDASQAAGLVVEGAVSAASFSGNGSGLTSLDGSAIASGTIADARLSTNVSLLDTAQTFTATQTFNTGIVLGNTASATTGALRWTGADFEGYDGLSWVSLTSGSGGGGTLTFDGFYAYDAVGNINITSGWTDLTLDTEVKEDAPYTHATDAAEVTINDDGWYEITFDVGTYITSGGARTSSRAKLVEDTGGGFTDIPGSIITMYNRNAANGYDSASGTITREFASGDVVKIQAQSFNGTDVVLTDANTVRLTIRKFVTPSGGGGGGTSFDQGGNSFGAAGILGTTDGNGLTIITNSNPALTFTSGGAADFAQSVDITGDLTLDSRLLRGTLTTPDAGAQAAFSSGLATNKGLIIQGVGSQTENLFEIQDSTGAVMAGFDASGGLVLGLSTVTSTATSGQSINLPDASGTVCLSGSDCGFLSLATGSFATDTTTNDSIAINKTGASGNLLALQKNGGAVFTVANTGSLQIQSTNSTALDVRNVGGTSYFSVDTSSGAVQVGSSVADAIGVLFVLDQKTGATDPTGQNGGIYYNATTAKFRCYEGGEWKDCIGTRQIRSFVDNTSDSVVDANTTNYWDTAAENNNTHPNITPTSTTKSVYGNISVQISAGTSQDRSVVTRVERGIGSVPTCGSGTVVGFYASTFTTNSGEIVTATVTFLDTPATTSQVFYTVCSDSNTSSASGMTVDKIRVTLEEANNSN